ncbi:MAG TPA: hypothetical protein VK512_15970 [Xanthobacteraceae bacterium]|nr:hypothetical protein [Xanthobacteraceae bacterium]
MAKTPLALDDFHAFKLSLEQPFWEPIGRFVFNFGLLERNIDMALIVLLGTETEVGEFVLKPIQSIPPKLNMLEALTRMRVGDHDLLNDMEVLTKELSDLNTFRNDLVHGGWYQFFGSKAGKIHGWNKKKITKTYKQRIFSATVDDINTMDAKIKRLGVDLIAVAGRAIDVGRAIERLPSPDKRG